ncbi:MAG: MYXO-CTERM sorting domain-containing protein [Polyangiaceae bacterium]
MNGSYGVGNIAPRDLDVDDVNGICTIYPPNRFGESGGCGCRVGAPTSAPSAWLTLSALALCAALRRRAQRGVRIAPTPPPQ